MTLPSTVIFAFAASGVFTVTDLSRAVQANETNVPFAIEGTLTHDGWVHYPYFSVSDRSGAIMMVRKPPLTPDLFRAGDIVRLRGVTVPGERRFACADRTNLEVERRSRELVADGQRVVAPEIGRQLRKHPPIPALTDRQKQILSAMVNGHTDADIANILKLSANSIRDHVTAIYNKLSASNRAEAVAIALRKHLLKI